MGKRPGRTAGWAALAALAVSALTGCGPKNNLAFEMQVFSAEQPFVETFKSLDSAAAQLDCSVSAGADTIYSLTRYQWARLNALALREKEVRRTFRQTFLMNDYEEFIDQVKTSGDQTIDVIVMVVPDSCCTFTLDHVEYAVQDAGGRAVVDFGCMWPVINNVLVELPPTSEGGRYTWILMDIEKIAEDEH